MFFFKISTRLIHKTERVSLIFLLFVTLGCVQTGNNTIIGTWLFNMGDEKIECPDLLIFSGDGTYTIHNDCYGDDIRLPAIEKGNWTFNPAENMITLKYRSFTSSYTFHDSSFHLKIYVKQISNNKLVICFNDERTCDEEVYIRKASK